MGIPVVSSQHPWGSFFPSFATHPFPREAGRFLPLFRLAFVVPEAKEEKLFLETSPAFCQRVLKLSWRIKTPGNVPGESLAAGGPELRPPRRGWPRLATEDHTPLVGEAGSRSLGV